MKPRRGLAVVALLVAGLAATGCAAGDREEAPAPTLTAQEIAF